MNFETIRVWFSKLGSARYISHLDLTRNMARALKLSGLPLWYTEGFNPRVYMSFAMPLSLGTAGEREIMDLRFVEPVPFPQIVERLGERLPKDLPVLAAAAPVHKLEEISWAEYELSLETEDSAALAQKLQDLLALQTIQVLKHSKKGDREVDIRPDFSDMEISCPDKETVALAMRLPCSVGGAVNPSLLLEALKRYEGEAPYARIVRKRLLLPDFSEIC